jgi:sugar phosphate isomerase/epimerase
MVTISAFADEVSQDLTEQLDVLESEGVKHIELRGVWDTPVLKMSDEQMAKMKEQMDQRGFKLSAVGSPIGKFRIDEDFDQQKSQFAQAIKVGKFFGIRNIRVFSYYAPEGDTTEKWRDQIMGRMRAFVDMAEEADMLMLHENEGGIYGESPQNCVDLIETMNSEHFKAIFDPANFVVAKHDPAKECYPLLKKHIRYFHIKDARASDRKVTPAGEGDGGLLEVLEDQLVYEGFKGFLSLEPHLKHAGKSGGFTGPDAFKVAAQALKKILDQIGAPYQ